MRAACHLLRVFQVTVSLELSCFAESGWGAETPRLGDRSRGHVVPTHLAQRLFSPLSVRADAVWGARA